MRTSGDLYLAACAPEQKTRGLQWVRSMGMAMINSQQMDAICDAYGPCQTIGSILKPVFLPISTYSLCL